MTFLWPSMLWALLAVPVAVGLYLWLNQRRRVKAFSFSGMQPARNPVPALRRHLPPALFLLSLVIILVALARPQAEVNLPRVEGTVILVFDVSASMSATDVQPSRLEAAKTAAREFVQSQPETVMIGIVSFSGNGFTVQSPTNDAALLLAAIDRLQPASGTSLGQGIYVALNTIAVDAGLEGAQPLTPDAQNEAPRSERPGSPEQDLLAQLPAGEYPPSVIVILSDGEHNQSIDPLEAAQAAAEHAVRIDALGFGTVAGAVLELEGFSVHTALDEETLRLITRVAGGAYYAAQSTQDPQAVYANLTPRLVVKPEPMEVTSLFAGAGIFLLLAGSMFSMLWFNRMV